MRLADRLRLYWDTLRHLKPVQIYGRLWIRLVRPRVDASPAPAVRGAAGAWALPAQRRPSLTGPSTFYFLNETGTLEASEWEGASATKLWLYNLHYFDDLNAADADARTNWHDALISRWIVENPPAQGTGWEPYPTSLRIVNWIKHAKSGRRLSEDAVQSLAVQTRWLTQRLEVHLLGNHLLANAKALVFAGCFFAGVEAEGWLARGLAILEREIAEQILADGGHFELSTMYHVLAVEDMLDLLNILRSAGRPVPTGWRTCIDAMRKWLSVMIHPDGEIAFFNDAAIGVAPSPAEIEAYALRLDLAPSALAERPTLTWLKDSGYIRVEQQEATALLDVARIGPDYLPGHAHADTLSFELSVAGLRALVNSGTSLYGENSERQRQRGTASHNTVTIDGGDSSEVWSSFRVARRARPNSLEVSEDGEVVVSCSHDGYRWAPGSPRHTRRWRFDQSGVVVTDWVVGPHGSAEARFFFHPTFRLQLKSGVAPTCGMARSVAGASLHWHIIRGRGRTEASVWHPEFGVSVASQCLVVELDCGESQIEFSWTRS